MMMMDTSIPTRAEKNKYSAMVSSRLSRSGLLVRIDTNENIHDAVSNTETIEVSSSMKWVSIGLAICRDVMIKRQNPKRLADVFKICGDVLLAIVICV
jgi:hypothetical protein